jgi:predicted nuclease of predicted toxin-antitoxin system
VKFKLDENLSAALADQFVAAGHDAHSVVEQALGGQPDDRVIDVCARERRALVTLDLDFANIHAYPPAKFPGIVVLRLQSQAHGAIEAAIGRMLSVLSQEALEGLLWIVEEHRIRIHD